MVRALLMAVVLVVGFSMASVAEAGWRHRRCGGHQYRGCSTNYQTNYYRGGCSTGGCYGYQPQTVNHCGGYSSYPVRSGCSSGVCY